jgi:hypothetical protein
MCGIAGYSIPETTPKETRAILAAVLAVRMDGRGGDSWGIARNGKVTRGLGDLAKGLPAAYLAEYPTLYLHTRRATTGASTRKNAHPFTCGHITGAHNGIVTNHDELNRKYRRAFQVDSKHIIQHLAKNRPLSEIQAYGAVWYYEHRRPNAVFLFRTTTGDLHVHGIGTLKDVHGIIWASTNTAIEEAAALAGLKTFPYEVKAHTLYFVENGNFYLQKNPRNIELGSPVWTQTTFQLNDPTTWTKADDLADDGLQAWQRWKRERDTWDLNDTRWNTGESTEPDNDRAGLAINEEYCDACGMIFDANELIPVQGTRVCETCLEESLQEHQSDVPDEALSREE